MNRKRAQRKPIIARNRISFRTVRADDWLAPSGLPYWKWKPGAGGVSLADFARVLKGLS